MAELFSSISNVESADVPVALKVFDFNCWDFWKNVYSLFCLIGACQSDFWKCGW
jgi:hypothetical protein